jgi:hypothetical protein
MTAISGVEFLIWLLIAASTIAVLAKYLRIPYTVALVLGGLLLSLLRLPFLSPLQPDQRPHWLTPDVILILFLPAPVFEGRRQDSGARPKRAIAPWFRSTKVRPPLQRPPAPDCATHAKQLLSRNQSRHVVLNRRAAVPISIPPFAMEMPASFTK